jgi:hypothetical protein
MNTRSARECAMFALAQLLRNWREQRPTNLRDLDLSVTVEVWKVYYTEVDVLLISFLYCSTSVFLGCVYIVHSVCNYLTIRNSTSLPVPYIRAHCQV